MSALTRLGYKVSFIWLLNSYAPCCQDSGAAAALSDVGSFYCVMYLMLVLARVTSPVTTSHQSPLQGPAAPEPRLSLVILVALPIH